MATPEQIADLVQRLQHQEALTAALHAQNTQLLEQQQQQAATFGPQLAAQFATLPPVDCRGTVVRDAIELEVEPD